MNRMLRTEHGKKNNLRSDFIMLRNVSEAA